MHENSYVKAEDTVLPPPSLGDAPGRMRTWGECGIEEKVDRLRNVLVGLQHTVSATRETCERLARHDHDAVGHVMVPLEDGRFASGTGFDWLA